MSDPIEVLVAECRLVEQVALGLSEDDFALPTRCPPWDVKVEEPDADLGWDDQTFIEKGTGRIALTDDERPALGERAVLFPLLA